MKFEKYKKLLTETVKWRTEVTAKTLTWFQCHVSLIVGSVLDLNLHDSHTTYKMAQYPYSKQGKFLQFLKEESLTLRSLFCATF